MPYMDYEAPIRSYAKEPILWTVIRMLEFVPTLSSMRNYLKHTYDIEMSIDRIKANYLHMEKQQLIIDTTMNPRYRINWERFDSEYKVD